MSSSEFLWVYLIWSSLSFSFLDLQAYDFHQIQEAFRHYFFEYFFSLTFSSPQSLMICQLFGFCLFVLLSYRLPQALFFYFFPQSMSLCFSACVSSKIVSIDPLSSSLILSSVILILLLSSSSKSVVVFLGFGGLFVCSFWLLYFSVL